MILIVDDHRDTCALLVRLLRRCGVPATGVSDPRAAIAAAKEIRPDLLVLDQSMPGLKGTDVLRALRSVPALADVPAIFYSAADEGREEAFELGALDWLPKGRIEWSEARERILSAYHPGDGDDSP